MHGPRRTILSQVLRQQIPSPSARGRAIRLRALSRRQIGKSHPQIGADILKRYGESAEVDVESAAAQEESTREWRGEGQVTMEEDVSADPAGRFLDSAFEGATPLSPADLGALASIGVEPSDGVGALRLLAALVRILNRNQLIEPDDLRAEIRESLAQGAAAAGSPAESDLSSAGTSGPSIETAET